ncbi:MAG: HNH endonuclease [Corallococcus sp.]|nr:HNH endonuclease [Corallococcus sp.]
MKNLNSLYVFYPYKSFDLDNTYDNEKFYENISCRDYLIYQLQFTKNDVVNQMLKIEENKRRYELYEKEINSISQSGKYAVAIGNLKLEKLLKKEQILFRQLQAKPTTRFSIRITLNCSKINGYTYKTKTDIFSQKDISEIIQKLNNRKGTFYNDRDIWNAICRVERGKVSNKMRFSIYARDGYRCKKCGVSSRYAQLEIDHIVPIAKGGKSVYNNLQTLCHRCNEEKGDSIY